MRIPERSPGIQLALALLIGALFPQAVLGGQTHRVSTVWIVKYISSSERISLTPRRKHFVVYLQRGTKLKVQLATDEISFQLGKKVLLSIPVAEVTGIAYDHKSHRLSRKVPSGMKSFSNCGLGCGFVLMGGAAAMLATLPFKYTDYFVLILWEENSTAHAIEVKVGKHDCQAFLNELQNVTKKPGGAAQKTSSAGSTTP